VFREYGKVELFEEKLNYQVILTNIRGKNVFVT